MKTALAIVAVVGFVASFAMGGQARFGVTRDAALHAHSVETHSNGGAGTQGRVGKGGPGLSYSQEWGIFQWDNAADIAQWMEAEAVAEGWADLADAVANGAVQVEFQVAAPADVPDKRVVLQTLWSENDWTEGDGPNNYANYNWTTDSAVTNSHAQDKLPDSTGAVDWVDPSTGESVQGRELPGLVNSAKIEGLLGTSDPGNVVWNGAVLDEAVWKDLILHENPSGYQTVGLATAGDGWGNMDNAQIYFRERWGDSADPSLLITIVPEPASMLLIGLGAVGLVLRRKR